MRQLGASAAPAPLEAAAAQRILARLQDHLAPDGTALSDHDGEGTP
jgi:hypothetical protein